MKAVLVALLLCSLAYIAICTILYLSQRSSIYYPTPEVSARYGTPLVLSNGSVKLKVWKVQEGREQALIYFGGNAEDVALNIPQFVKLFPDHTLYLHNYRGYGGSGGSPTERGLLSDALLLYDQVRSTHKGVDVVGRSLGTGVATYLAANRDVERLVLVTPFDSLVNVASAHFPLFPVKLLMKDRYESFSYAPRLGMPKLILLAERDEIIPRRNSERLIDFLDRNTTRVTIIGGADHNSISVFREYEEAMAAFLTVE